MDSPSFDNFHFSSSLQQGLDAMGYTQPTEIQQKAIPLIQQGYDLIGCAQTGTGKTAAFLLPLIDKLVTHPPSEDEASILVIVPTRELSMQIDQQIEGLGYFTHIASRAIFGGNDSAEWSLQKHSLTQGAHILVATPGRLIQFIQLGIAKLDAINTLVLDEADRMLDMGFMPDIELIVQQLPRQRQTLMFSATMPPKVRTLAKKILHQPKEVDIAVSKPAENIAQQKLLIDKKHKITFLVKYLQARPELQSVIIFADKIVTVRDLARALLQQGLEVLSIHSNLNQEERENALTRFKGKQIRILVATDILARGIDIDNIDMVVNYNVPHSPESYVHRVGRTARAERNGEAITLVASDEDPKLHDIEKLLGAPIPPLTLPDSIEVPPRTTPPSKGRKKKPKHHNYRTKGQRKKNSAPTHPSKRKKKNKGHKPSSNNPPKAP